MFLELLFRIGSSPQTKRMRRKTLQNKAKHNGGEKENDLACISEILTELRYAVLHHYNLTDVSRGVSSTPGSRAKYRGMTGVS